MVSFKQAGLRKKAILQVVNTLNEAEVQGVALNEKQFILQICGEFECSRRTAIEYLNVGRELWRKQQQ